MDTLLEMLRHIGSPVDALTIAALEENMRAGAHCQLH